MDDPMYWLALVCYYGPTPLAGLLAGWQAAQCKAPWHAFAVACVGTVALAVVFGIAADYLPAWGVGPALGFDRMWKFHLAASLFLAVPLGIFCAVWVSRRDGTGNP